MSSPPISHVTASDDMGRDRDVRLEWDFLFPMNTSFFWSKSVKHDKDVFLHRQDACEPHHLPGLHRGGDEVDVRHLILRYTTDIAIHH